MLPKWLLGNTLFMLGQKQDDVYMGILYCDWFVSHDNTNRYYDDDLKIKLGRGLAVGKMVKILLLK